MFAYKMGRNLVSCMLCLCMVSLYRWLCGLALPLYIIESFKNNIGEVHGPHTCVCNNLCRSSVDTSATSHRHFVMFEHCRTKTLA
jgi:hypothetical protein